MIHGTRNVSLLRNSLVTTLFIVCQTCSAYAEQEQQPEAYITDLWQVYVSRCALALENAPAFINTLPSTNTGGGPSSVMTDDQVVLVSSTSVNGFTVDADIISISDGLNISCHVFPSLNRMFDLEDFSAADIETALRNFLISQGFENLSGGEIKNAFSGPQEGDELEYNYVIKLVISGRSVLTRFEMTEGDLGVYFAGINVSG
jgi:hypothetical protein